MTPRALVQATLLGGGLLALVASAQPWWHGSAGGSEIAFTGADATGGLSQALPAVVLVGSLLVLVLRVRGRRILAVLLALAAAGQVVVGVLRVRPGSEAVRARIRQVSLADQFALEPTAWGWLYAGAGLVVLVGAVLLWRGGAGWSAPGGDRFHRRTSAQGRRQESGVADDHASLWRAQDAGVDPTDDPDVRVKGRRATMDGQQTTE